MKDEVVIANLLMKKVVLKLKTRCEYWTFCKNKIKWSYNFYSKGKWWHILGFENDFFFKLVHLMVIIYDVKNWNQTFVMAFTSLLKEKKRKEKKNVNVLEHMSHIDHFYYKIIGFKIPSIKCYIFLSFDVYVKDI